MAYDFAASLQGVRSAWDSLGQTAHRIAAGSVNARRVPLPGADKNPISGKPAGPDAGTAQLDLPLEMLNLNQAAIGVKANTRVMSVENELDRTTLDILA